MLYVVAHVPLRIGNMLCYGIAVKVDEDLNLRANHALELLHGEQAVAISTTMQHVLLVSK
jgi:hypothetical protein